MKSMKKILALAAASVLAVSLAACGSLDDSTGEDKNAENRSSAEETTQEADRGPAGSETGDTSANGSRILIAYFTAAENSGVDAEASASYSEVDGEAKGRMQALYSFFDEYDFAGKTIIPFNTHNGSRFSNTIETIAELEPDAEVIEDGFTVNERDVPDAAGDIATGWKKSDIR